MRTVALAHNADLSVGKQVRTGASRAAPASSAFGNSSVGQINNQANNLRMPLRVQF